jgi:hypothetical protein
MIFEEPSRSFAGIGVPSGRKNVMKLCCEASAICLTCDHCVRIVKATLLRQRGNSRRS